MSSKKASVYSCLQMKTLPEHDFMFSLCNEVCTVLESESIELRPSDKFGNPGSLIELKKEIPVIVIPDIHGRPEFIQNFLDYELNETFGFSKAVKLGDALKKKQIYVVCVGDGIHTELTKDRWVKIQEEADKENLNSSEMKEEMLLNLRTLTALMKLKIENPEHFYFLKGNHENILNATGDGDFAFTKYADEGELCRNFISSHYGDDILYLIHYYEKALPLVAFSKSANCVISHAEPADFYLRGDVLDGHLYPEVVAGLTWTLNEQVTENTALFLMKNLLEPENCSKAFYFSGHRPVKEKYALRQNGQFIQIHNPHQQNIAVVLPGKDFDPETNIVSVN